MSNELKEKLRITEEQNKTLAEGYGRLLHENERLREALEDIKKHQEIASGTLSSLSATYHIVSKALEVKGE